MLIISNTFNIIQLRNKVNTYFDLFIIQKMMKMFDKQNEYIYNVKSNAKIFSTGGVFMKRTYQPNNRKRSKKQGFLARMKTNIINNRRRKGRKVLSH